MSGRGRDETGNRYGMLTVIALDSKSKNGTCKWRCRCDCGGETVVFSTSLRSTKPNQGTKSCGCQRGKNSTHGMTGSPEFLSWRAMKSRCTNPNNPDHHNYGGRGITYDQSWESFEQFTTWTQ